jgi:hypothetical protein
MKIVNTSILAMLLTVLGGTHAVVARDNSGGASSAGYTCSGLFCQCTGDDDCNKMFEDNVCGQVADCNLKTGVCTCSIFAKAPPRSRLPSGVYTPPPKVSE